MAFDDLVNAVHGRETKITYYEDYILKQPLNALTDEAKDAWLAKQKKTKQIIDDVVALRNPAYYVPRMLAINDEDHRVLEERALGYNLTQQLFARLSPRQKFELVNSFASFLVDMNESKPVKPLEKYKICSELKFSRLDSFVNSKIQNWPFTNNEKYNIARIRDEVAEFEYDTRKAWSHGDLNSGNILYNPDTNQLAFIDFAESGYKYIYRDVFSPVSIELDLYEDIYAFYRKLHNSALYDMPSPKDDNLKRIMKYRILVALLKRFIKASDDLRLNSGSEKAKLNNQNKVEFMKLQMQKMDYIESLYGKGTK